MSDRVNLPNGKIRGRSLLGILASKGADAVTNAATTGIGLLGQNADLANEAMKALAAQGASKSAREFIQNAIQTQINVGIQAVATQGASASLTTFTSAVGLATTAPANMVASAGGGNIMGILGALAKGAAGTVGATGAVETTGIVPSAATAFTVPSYSFANGEIMAEFGAIPLRRYAKRGIARNLQLTIYGEGRKPKAYVPLQDDRTIPMTMNGNQSAGDVNITINVAGDGSSSATRSENSAARSAWKGAANQVRSIVQYELAKQRRTNGLLRN
ncbi:hypothetical protein [Castellaniella sp. UC4442_H9]